jgi:Lectin C-type domain
MAIDSCGSAQFQAHAAVLLSTACADALLPADRLLARRLLMPPSQSSLEGINMKRNLCEVFGKLSIFSLVALVAATGCGPEQLEPASEGKPVAPEEVNVSKSAIVYGGHDYLFVTTPVNWDWAKMFCQQAGYSLVTINDASEEAFLQTQEFHRGLYNWWIGANDKGIEGSWGWSNGTSSYANWYPGEPNNGGNGEDCAVDRFSWKVGGIYDERWNDSPCEMEFPFICERDSAPTVNQGSFSYSASNTYNATVNTYNYSLPLRFGQIVTVGTCGVPGASGSGDTYLRILRNGSPITYAENDDAGSPCGVLSNISFFVYESATYTIQAGCYGSGSCSGTVAITY